MCGIFGTSRWGLQPSDVSSERRLVAALGVSPLIARVLVARGFTDVEDARRFLEPDLERDWCDPMLIPGMAEVADRVEAALTRGERMAVYGDFDVDGMTATSLLTLGLQELGADVHPFIPNRFGEGYGLSEAALARMMDICEPRLVITVDNGIAAGQEVGWLLDRGVDVVITDHHEPGVAVPTGIPVTDPKLDDSCPSRELAGAGVALKLLDVLGTRLGRPELWRSYTELAMLGTVSDMMQLTGENRSLVEDGIKHLRESRRPGILALAQVAGIDLTRITADALPFSLVPRLNAAGRMGSTDIAFQLLYTGDAAEASVLAARLEQVNAERRETEQRLTDMVMAQIEDSYDGGRCVVAAGEGWHEGVKGIVASRMVNQYHVPAILFSVQDGMARGSGRTVGSVDLYRAVERCSDLLVRFGGHTGAVGVTCEASKVDAFRARLEQVLDELPDEDFHEHGEVTALVELSEMSLPNIMALDALQPFGQGNKKPLFAARSVLMRNRCRVGAAGNHLRFVATDGAQSVPAIMFRTPDIDRAIACEEPVDLVFEAMAETWQGKTKPKLMVRDILYRDEGADGTAGGGVHLSVPLIAGGASDAQEDESLAHLGEHAVDGSAMPTREELTEALRDRMIGPHALLPAQQAVLGRLDEGRSCLCVMATGRGKSLIFHLHAAREALGKGRASIFVYPLRALVADQRFHLEQVLSPFGIGVSVLTGETPDAERDKTFQALVDGRTHIVLTTPEFLAIHAARFARAGRVGFVVIDEAHHAGASSGGHRGAYAQLPQVLSRLGHPVVLACTATAGEEVAAEICDLLSIDHGDVVRDESVRDNLHVDDGRGIRDRERALVDLVRRGEKSVVYVNSREGAMALVRMLRHALPDQAMRISYYHAGLSRRERLLVERSFRDGRLCCIVATSAFGEGVNIPDIRHAVLYHLPFGEVEFNQMSGRAGRDGQDSMVHLMYQQRDRRINEHLLECNAPAREALKSLYRVLMRETRRSAGPSGLTLDDAQLAELASSLDARHPLDASAVSAGIGIFRELGFLRVEGFGETRRICMREHPAHADLEESAYYLEGLRAKEAFADFSRWCFEARADELLKRINHPIAPSFGQLV